MHIVSVTMILVICLSERIYMGGNQKHLTLSDRFYIQQELTQGTSFKAIAANLKKDQTTISKEIKLHRIVTGEDWINYKCRTCTHYKDCKVRHVCNNTRCPYLCRTCHHQNPTLYCSQYVKFTCNRLKRAPYVCNSCAKFNNCLVEKARYDAVRAQKEYEKTLSSSREGINLTSEELISLNNLISPLVLKGQPLSHIFAVHSDEIPVCRRTLYNYLDQRIFTARNIDLPRRVRYKKRKKRAEPRLRNVTQEYRNKRTYVDFEKYVAAFPDLDVVEMDTVKGTRDAGKCLLTLLFRSCSFMIIILLPNCTQKSVVAAINHLCDKIGLNTFKKYFPIILTDNGSEFKNPWDIEKDAFGTSRTRVFYCDPYISNQKGRLEKNHEYIRYVIPKGRSMYSYTTADISLLASHINSTARDSLNGATPFDLAEILLDKRIPVLTGQYKVSPDDVLLKPALLDSRHSLPKYDN